MSSESSEPGHLEERQAEKFPQNLWRVAVDAPINSVLTYQSSDVSLKRGLRVAVPLGKRLATGVVLGPQDPGEFAQRYRDLNREADKPLPALKTIERVDEEFPALSDLYLRWLEWLSHYYLYPIGQVVELAYPPLRRSEKTRGSRKSPAVPTPQKKERPQLNECQQAVVKAIEEQAKFGVHLIYGVTGSGKTEVYLELLEGTLARGQTALILVPEISLTPQLLRRFAERFGDQIATLHSQLTDREKTEQWWSIREGKKRVLIGARSAIFCPLENLGLIVIDEEHESSFKQDEKLKYHARDAAIMLAKECGCPVVLGSATPSLESWKNAKDGKFQLHTLPGRFGDQPLPAVRILDLRTARREPHLPHWMTADLFEALNTCLERGDQSALFLNRRGVASSVVCAKCGHSPQCPDCDIHLTLHGRRHLVCHYCNYSQAFHEECVECRGPVLPMGLGTEQVEKDVSELFPSARVARADRDEIATRQDLEEMVTKMETGEIDILIGTQMIAKGFDFPRLRFAGLVLADIGFNLPDFRATERSFQVLTQMSGRAGRHNSTAENPGTVIIQTYNPEHPSLNYAPTGDYVNFANWELKQREDLGYPPAQRMAMIRVQSPHRDRAWKYCLSTQKMLTGLLTSHLKNHGLEILGPAEAPLARVRRSYRFQILLKCAQVKSLEWACRKILDGPVKCPPGIKVSIDIDPLHVL